MRKYNQDVFEDKSNKKLLRYVLWDEKNKKEDETRMQPKIESLPFIQTWTICSYIWISFNSTSVTYRICLVKCLESIGKTLLSQVSWKTDDELYRNFPHFINFLLWISSLGNGVLCSWTTKNYSFFWMWVHNGLHFSQGNEMEKMYFCGRYKLHGTLVVDHHSEWISRCNHHKDGMKIYYFLSSTHSILIRS